MKPHYRLQRINPPSGKPCAGCKFARSNGMPGQLSDGCTTSANTICQPKRSFPALFVFKEVVPSTS